MKVTCNHGKLKNKIGTLDFQKPCIMLFATVYFFFFQLWCVCLISTVLLLFFVNARYFEGNFTQKTKNH